MYIYRYILLPWPPALNVDLFIDLKFAMYF